MKSLLPLRVERDRAITGFAWRSYPRVGAGKDISTRCGSVMELARNRENCGVYPTGSVVVTQLDTQFRPLDENRTLSHGRSVIVHYEPESQSDAPSQTRRDGPTERI